MRKKYVIIGATSKIAENMARLWVEREALELFLVGRNKQRLQKIRDDLLVRNPENKIHAIESVFDNADDAAVVVDSICAQHQVDLVLIAHGYLPSQEACQENLHECETTLLVNGVSPVILAEGFARHMQTAGKGRIVLMSSVAGDRGRKSNYTYGAAKGLVSRYGEGMQHRFAGSNIKVHVVKPGPTFTPMTASIANAAEKFARPEEVAASIIRDIKKNRPVIYAPRKWFWIMLVIRHLPGLVFNRINI